MQGSLSALLDGLPGTSQDYQGEPLPGSQYAEELSESTCLKSVATPLSIANLLIESSCEHLSVFIRACSNPVEAMACYTCIRSMLESCAIASWLLSPELSADQRIGRSLAIRYSGLVQQLKYARSKKQAVNDGADETIQSRIDEIEELAKSLGFDRIVDRNGRLAGVAYRMPSATDLIQSELNQESQYRLLSAVAHGHAWAITELGYEPDPEVGAEMLDGRIPVQAMRKKAFVDGLAYLCLTGSEALARPVVSQHAYLGLDMQPLEALLDKCYDELGVVESQRFWRSA